MSEEMQIVEYEGIRVVTTKQIAEMYGASPKKVSNNFNANKGRYTEGKHYFILQGQELKDFLDLSRISGQDKRPPKLYLWTNRGALLLAKSINTDIAWQAYERLVDFYFESKVQFNPTVDQFPEVRTRVGSRTTSTPVPRNKNWYKRNIRRMNLICERAGTPMTTLYHYILLKLEEQYDLDAAREIFQKELGHPPKYALDIVSYFPELASRADEYLDRLEELQTSSDG